MILDGYTLFGVLGSLRFHYRPMLDAERRAVVKMCRAYGGKKGRQVACEAIERHIVDRDGDWRTDELEPEAYRRLGAVILGVKSPDNDVGWSRSWEADDAANLHMGLVLERTNPRLARRDCGWCQKWWVDHETGEIAKRGSKPLLRPDGYPTICRTHEGCAKGTPERSKALSEKNRQAYRFHLECRAIGAWPADPIVRRNAKIIEQVLYRG